MPASEIDDIFASKGKAPPAVVPSSSSQPADAKKKKQKKAKKSSEQAQEQPPSSVSSTKRKRDDHESTTPKVEHTAKRRVPETVLDPSAQLAAPSKGKSKPETSNTSSRPRPSKKARPEKEDQERFKDSRGTGPRRKTEEGFLIYKYDELGITGSGGDTPQCPFDCQCCF